MADIMLTYDLTLLGLFAFISSSGECIALCFENQRLYTVSSCGRHEIVQTLFLTSFSLLLLLRVTAVCLLN